MTEFGAVGWLAKISSSIFLVFLVCRINTAVLSFIEWDVRTECLASDSAAEKNAQTLCSVGVHHLRKSSHVSARGSL